MTGLQLSLLPFGQSEFEDEFLFGAEEVDVDAIFRIFPYLDGGEPPTQNIIGIWIGRTVHDSDGAWRQDGTGLRGGGGGTVMIWESERVLMALPLSR